MAQIAEDLFLLLLDNSSGAPALEPQRRQRVLAAAVLLDLAHACRVRPAVPGEPYPAGHLVALTGVSPLDPVTGPAFDVLLRRPLPPAGALAKLRKHTEAHVVRQLEQSAALPIVVRDRVEPARAAVLAALFDRAAPTPPTAAIICLLHAVDGLGALLSLNDRGWRWVHARAGEIALGSWVEESPTALPEMNLAVTASALRSALA